MIFENHIFKSIIGLAIGLMIFKSELFIVILKFTKKSLSLDSATSDVVEISFGSWGNKLYLFHLFGIHVLSELSFPPFPINISSRMHIYPEISVSLVWKTNLTFKPIVLNHVMMCLLTMRSFLLSSLHILVRIDQ